MRKIIAVFLMILCVALGALLYWTGKDDDRNPPVISFSEEELQYEQGEDTAKLLKDVTAQDDVDGDVSDTLVVESVIPIEGEQKATVLYYAKDESNNVAKARRIVSYIPGDGILWQAEAESETQEAADSEGTTETEEAENLSSGSPRMVLTTNKATVKDGEYNLLSYVKEITDDKDGADWLYYQIQIEGRHDISGPGTYELYYFVYDRDGNCSNRAKLTLTIE
ncbi:MAG: hypothetical protein Q4C50_09200 [Eubacteriales bacterium]|nr:hypothetical protein [Eubacteriales bacterium]